jgi:type IV secretory pathway VirB10-like protein
MKELPPHTVAPWTLIYAVLETAIRSDHPSDVLARLNQPVRDATMSEVLIPAGCHLHGWQDGSKQVLQTAASVIVEWDQIQCTDHQPIDLHQMASMDPQGFNGLDGDVNHRYGQIYGQALLISAITAGVSLAQHPTYGGYQGIAQHSKPSDPERKYLAGELWDSSAEG